MTRCRSVFCLLMVLLASRAFAVVPGGIYGTDDSIHLTLDPNLLEPCSAIGGAQEIRFSPYGKLRTPGSRVAFGLSASRRR